MRVLAGAKKVAAGVLLLVAALALVVGVAGCSGEEESGELVVGEEAEGALSVVLTNGLGDDIEAVEVRAADAEWDEDDETEGFEALEIADDGVWAADVVARIYVDEDADGTEFDLRLTVGSETYVLHAVDFSADDEATVLVDAETGLAYLSHLDEDGTEASSTLADEIAIYEAEMAEEEAVEEEEDEEEEAEEAEAVEEDEADEEADEATETSSSDTSSSSSGTSSSSSSSTTSTTSSGSSGSSSSSSSGSTTSADSSGSDASSSSDTSTSTDTSTDDTSSSDTSTSTDTSTDDTSSSDTTTYSYDTSTDDSSASQDEDVCLEEDEVVWNY